MISFRLGVVASLCLVACACGDKSASPPVAVAAPERITSGAPASSSVDASSASKAKPFDVGAVRSITVTARGEGSSAADAVDDAIRAAIMQTNGVTVDMSSARYRLALDVAVGQDAATLRANGFAQRIVEQAGGTITSFRVVELIEPDTGVLASVDKQPRLYKATIEAAMPKFEAPASLNKIKIVVGPLRTSGAVYMVGDRRVPAQQLADEVRQQIIAGLSNTGRFSILDRDFDDQIQQELSLISSG